MKSYCPQCGTILEHNSHRCPKCGMNWEIEINPALDPANFTYDVKAGRWIWKHENIRDPREAKK